MARRRNNRCVVRGFLEDVSVRITGCWQWIGTVNRAHHGYGDATFQGRRVLAHRFMWELFHDQLVPDGKIIRHSCDNTLCVNPDHLILGTQQENIQDMIDRDRHRAPKGVDHPRYKVTETLIKEARTMRRRGHNTKEIASSLGLGLSTISHILNARSRYALEAERHAEEDKEVKE